MSDPSGSQRSGHGTNAETNELEFTKSIKKVFQPSKKSMFIYTSSL